MNAAAAYLTTTHGLDKLSRTHLADTESNNKMLKFLLAKRCIQSVVAVNGVEAVACIEADPDRFELIFMDNTMPIMVRIAPTPLIHT